jgi:phosphorylcholine metabolism protein LicD
MIDFSVEWRNIMAHDLKYKRYDKALNVLYDNLNKIVEKSDLEHKKIYMFGTSKIATMIISFLQKENVSLCGIIDNDKSRHGFIIENLEVYSPDILRNYDKDVIVLIASSYQNEMIKQLQDMGYKYNDNIIKVIDLQDLMEDYSFVDRNGYKEMSPEDIRTCQLNLMKYLKKVCDENGIDYYLTYGTLLGAVRHKGFIPWDDDVDVSVDGKEIDRLAELINKSDRYQLITCKNCDGYFDQISLLIDKTTVVDFNQFPLQTTTGISIDIFPIYGLPDSPEEFKDYIEKIKELEKKKWNNLYNPVECKKYTLEMDDFISSYKFEDYQHTGFVLSPYFTKDYLKRSVYGEKKYLMFEDEEFCVPHDYKNVLETIYGDYMELPPVNKRGGHHYYKVYYEI